MPSVCLACELLAPEQPPPAVCPRCGVVDSFTATRDGAAPEDKANAPLSLANEPARFVRRRTGDRAADALFGGGLPLGTTTLVYSKPGIGKSTVLLRWAAALGRAVLVCPEMSLEVLQATAARSGANLEALFPATVDDWPEVARRASASVLLLDSISVPAAYPPVRTLGRIRAWAERSALALVIAHQGKGHRPLGPRALAHDPDCVARLERDSAEPGALRLCLDKCRFAPLGRGRLWLTPTAAPPAQRRRKRRAAQTPV